MDILKLIAVVIFILSGCASPTKGMTPEQAVAYEVKAEYVREDKRLQRHEEIFAARAQCKAHNMVWWTMRFSSFENRRMDRDPTYLPRHAHMFDFACTSARDAKYIIDQALGNDGFGRRYPY